MSGSLFLRLCLVLPLLAAVVARLLLEDPGLRMIASLAAPPYAVFAAFFWGYTIEYTERRLRRALVFAPLAFVPVLALFILVLFMAVHGATSVLASLALAGVCSLVVGYGFVALTLGSLAMMRRLHAVGSEPLESPRSS